MLTLTFNKSGSAASKDPARKKDIVVRIVNASTDTKPKRVFVDETEIAKQYKEEVKVVKHANLVQGLAVGAAIGVLICALAQVTGTILSGGEMAAMVGVPAVVGIIAGFVLS